MQTRGINVGLLILTATLVVGVFFVWPNTIWCIASIFFGEWSGREMRFTVSSTADDRLIVTFDQRTVKYGRHPFCVIDFAELVPSKRHKRRVVWSIRQNSGPWIEKLDSFTYGQCLPSFEQTLPPEPLLEGHFYLVCEAEVVRKVSSCNYEVIPYDLYLLGVETGLYKDAKD